MTNVQFAGATIECSPIFQASLRDANALLIFFPALKGRAQFTSTLRVEKLVKTFLKFVNNKT